jgi:Arc/MetJ-type ribon-helix-helix transcriptional regulator
MDTEKVCVNLPAAEIGKIDVLVAEGQYSSRTDLIRAGIRRVLDENSDVSRYVSQGARIGYQLLARAELEMAKRAGRKLKLFVIGVLRIQSSVTPELADEAIDGIQIFGSVKGPPEVLDRLEPKIVRGFQV